MKATFFSSSSQKIFITTTIIAMVLAILQVIPVHAADTNLQSPTQDIATAAGDGDGFELNPANAYADGGGFASNINGGGDQHIYYGYDLSAIPSGDIIDGIEVRLDWYLDSISATNSMSVQLSWDGGTTWTAAQSTTPTEPIVETTMVLGGPLNNWGHTWSVTSLNATNELSSTNFRVRVNSNSSSTFRDFYLDWIPVRVYSHTPPEIDIQGNAISITNGDNTPVAADDTEFGNVEIGFIVDHTFTILNTGPTTLNLSNVTLTGSPGFSVQTPPAASVPPAGSTTFVIRFAPTATGFSNSKTATFFVDTNDPDENPYTFDVHGTRLINEINIRGNGIMITDGDVTPSLTDGTNWGNVGVGVAVDRTFTINNTGTADLTIGAITFVGGNAADFSVVSAPISPVLPGGSTTFTIRLTAGALALRSTTLNIVNDDSNENPYDFSIQGNGITGASEIEVLKNNITITDGDITPSTIDGTDLGSVVIGNSTVVTYIIKNNGAVNLTIGAFTFTGDFSLATAPATPVTPGSSTTFQVRFTPASTGVINGTVSFANNDASENPYNFSLTGTGVNNAPTDISLSNSAVDENQPINTVVGTLTATDPDAGAMFTFSLACAVASVDDASFNIGGANLRTSALFDFETKSVYNICIRVTDQGGLTFDKIFVVSVNDLNEISPTVTINQAVGQADPTNASPIVFDVVFSVTVADFDATDVTISGIAGLPSISVIGAGTTYTVSVTGMASGETVAATLAAGVAHDAAGNASNASTSTDNTVTYNTSAFNVTINQAAGQADPANTLPINFTVVFSAATTDFATGDVTLSGTAGATTATVTGSGTTYNVSVSGMTTNGTVIATIAGGVATDTATNPNVASISTDNTVTYDSVYPTVVSTDLTVSYTGTGPGSFIATFSKDVDNPAGNTGTDDVTNPTNYLLVNKGTNSVANTASCASGIVIDDTQVTVTSVIYNRATFQATVTLASALPVGSYRLFICGTTSIVDLAGNPLNGGTDYTFDFVVQAVSARLPGTGFPQGKVTTLPFQPMDKMYTTTDLWLEIPKLGIKMSIAGVPKINDGWDVTWLDKKAGWLNGSAYPTWNGNSVLTGHVWDALNKPGPFAQLKSLKYGDQVKIHAFGMVYTYEITESSLITNTDAKTAFKHEDKSVITLITCESYKEVSGTYTYRRMVRAVLMSVTKEK